MAYSGYTFEQLLELSDPFVKKLLGQLDLLVDGPFIMAEKNIELRFRGSANQRVLDVPKSLEANELSGRSSIGDYRLANGETRRTHGVWGIAAVAPRQQEGRHLRFLPSLTPVSLWNSTAKFSELRYKGTAEDFFCRRGAQCAPISLPLRNAGFRTATHAVYSTQAQHNSVARLFFALLRTAPAGFI